MDQTFTLDSLLGESFPPSLCFRGFRILVEGMCHLASVEPEVTVTIEADGMIHRLYVKDGSKICGQQFVRFALVSGLLHSCYTDMHVNNDYFRLTCRPSPFQGGLSLSVDLSIPSLDVPYPLMQDRGGTPDGGRKKRKRRKRGQEGENGP